MPCSQSCPQLQTSGPSPPWVSGLLQANSTVPLDWSSQSSLALGAGSLTQVSIPQPKQPHLAWFPASCYGESYLVPHSFPPFWILRWHSGPHHQDCPFSCCLPVNQAAASLRPGQAQPQHNLSHFRKPGVPGIVSLAHLSLSHTAGSGHSEARCLYLERGESNTTFIGSLGINCFYNLNSHYLGHIGCVPPLDEGLTLVAVPMHLGKMPQTCTSSFSSQTRAGRCPRALG